MEYSFRRFAIRCKYTGHNLHECEVPLSIEDDMIQTYVFKDAVANNVDLCYADLCNVKTED